MCLWYQTVRMMIYGLHKGTLFSAYRKFSTVKRMCQNVYQAIADTAARGGKPNHLYLLIISILHYKDCKLKLIGLSLIVWKFVCNIIWLKCSDWITEKQSGRTKTREVHQ